MPHHMISTKSIILTYAILVQSSLPMSLTLRVTSGPADAEGSMMMSLMPPNETVSAKPSILKKTIEAPNRTDVDASLIMAPGGEIPFERATTLLGGNSALNMSSNITLSGIALVYVSGRSMYDAALQSAVLSHVPMGGIYKVRGKDPAGFNLALEWAVAKYPNARWYYLADDDSFVVLQRLAGVASRYNSLEYHFIGELNGVPHHICAMADAKCRHTTITSCKGPGFVCGGPGVLISAALANRMADAKCAEYYSPIWNFAWVGGAGDVQLACCAWDAWENRSEYHVDDNPKFLFNPSDEMSPGAMAIHHISSETTILLGKRYNQQIKRYNGSNTTNTTIITLTRPTTITTTTTFSEIQKRHHRRQRRQERSIDDSSTTTKHLLKKRHGVQNEGRQRHPLTKRQTRVYKETVLSAADDYSAP
eukprot:gnl/TRDRNA2_/TRDRNA2_177424_c4_seq2.p1 gnl/TRDRNA2_/TRDRNA2_177424_c4~~gnl/TRDRNA2_/TRDRNA2_177424_c4_seq2.p1  ORF type:complete len:421 (+),score=18.49 gnl/TRDRNA2_/TRDRNA2_177424_c4_seq2:105-1367(+)